jgi:hypothetical protein
MSLLSRMNSWLHDRLPHLDKGTRAPARRPRLTVTALEDRQLLSTGLASSRLMFATPLPGPTGGQAATTTSSPVTTSTPATTTATTGSAAAPATATSPATSTAATTGTAVYPYAPGGYICWGVGEHFTGVTLDAGIVGIDLYVNWQSIQTGPNTYDWTHLDSTIQEAQAHGLKVSLMLSDGPTHVPLFILRNPAVEKIWLRDTNPYHSTYGQIVGGPVFWDPTYLAARIAFIQALGARYSGNTGVVGVTCGAANWYCDDWTVPAYVGQLTVGSTTYNLNQVAQWQKHGYTTAKMEAVIQEVMDATAAAFPHQALKFEAGVTVAALDGTTTALATQALNYGYSTYGGRFYAQVNFLSAVTPLATDPTLGQHQDSMNYLYYLLEQHPGQVGFQVLGSATDGPTNNYRDNGGVAAPVTTVMQNAISAGLSYKPMFIEFWQNDASNAAFAGMIQQATQTMQAHP